MTWKTLFGTGAAALALAGCVPATTPSGPAAAPTPPTTALPASSGSGPATTTTKPVTTTTKPATTTTKPATTTTKPATTTAPTTTLPTGPSTWWKPTAGTSWQYQLSGKIDSSVAASVYIVDGEETPATTVAALHAAGRKVVCYLSAGSWEDWRSDAGAFPAGVLGNGLDGWPGERWLDVRQLSILQPLMAARMDACKAKGFDGVDPDNVDGYSNATGFAIKAADQLAYDRMLAQLAHDRGLAVGLKNDVDQVAALAPTFDYAVNEECAQYRECDLERSFITADKPVFHVEYGTDTSICTAPDTTMFSTIVKKLSLDAWRLAC